LPAYLLPKGIRIPLDSIVHQKLLDQNKSLGNLAIAMPPRNFEMINNICMLYNQIPSQNVKIADRRHYFD